MTTVDRSDDVNVGTTYPCLSSISLWITTVI